MNFTVLKEEICHEHDKPNTLICIDCRKNVCDKCKVFGVHKAHNLKTMKEIINEIA